MRRFDVWVGRIAAVAGLIYVVLCSLWPLSASAAEGGVPSASSTGGDGTSHAIGVAGGIA